ncbi:GbsR/MarR family transcriptional regulator [Desulfuribacillus alkaliarsenatis]|uniref:HTH-type transcriptional regulator n=1 Tax=Desulfuribacillus alkaliarsenatis TaxID=766136 RepID=A0A1E5G197_9FIRM|nr:hypothetical protein [Desulfuribacillus alkaliarsenatis]OEF96689.1 hypothetical protein BHF68_06335 [Desulfuribacillus alkaliarsenatis]
MGAQERLDKARERVIESIADNMDLYGVPPSVGRLYGTLYFHGEPMTLDEMKESLKMSKTSMSTGIKTLMELNCVERVWKKGERKDYYQAKEDWQQIFIDYFSIQWKKAIMSNLESLQKSKKELQALIAEHTTENSKQHPNSEQLESPQSSLFHAQQDIEKIDYAINYYHWLIDNIAKLEQTKSF